MWENIKKLMIFQSLIMSGDNIFTKEIKPKYYIIIA